MSRSNHQLSLRVAVITPYYREPLEILRHCHDSVRTQTYPCTHFLVADGNPQKELATWRAQHLILANSHADLGSTPRSVGSLSAMNQGFDAVAYLDADNWYYPNHVEAMVNLHRETGAPVCTATRSIHRLDGSLMYIDWNESDGKNHVDTNCFFLTRPAFRMLPLWAMIPKQICLFQDRLFWQSVQVRRLQTAHHEQPTVSYRTLHQAHYHNIGDDQPAGAKTSTEFETAARWWNSLPEEVRTEWSNDLAPPTQR